MPNSSRQTQSCPVGQRFFSKTYFWIIDRKTWKKRRIFSEWPFCRCDGGCRKLHIPNTHHRQRLHMTCSPAAGCCMCPSGGRKLLPDAKNAARTAAAQSCTERTAEEHLDMCGYAPSVSLSGKLPGDESEGKRSTMNCNQGKEKKNSDWALLPSEACVIRWRPFFFPPLLLSLIQAKERRRWRLAPPCHCFLPARWQRGQPAPRCSSPFTDQPPSSSSPLADKEEGEERAAPKCECLLNELRSDTRPLEFGAFKQPSSSSFLLLLLCLPSSLHTLLLSSHYCGWSCWAAAFKPGASVTGKPWQSEQQRLWSCVEIRVRREMRGKWSQAVDRRRTDGSGGRRFLFIRSCNVHSSSISLFESHTSHQSPSSHSQIYTCSSCDHVTHARRSNWKNLWRHPAGKNSFDWQTKPSSRKIPNSGRKCCRERRRQKSSHTFTRWLEPDSYLSVPPASQVGYELKSGSEDVCKISCCLPLNPNVDARKKKEYLLAARGSWSGKKKLTTQTPRSLISVLD